MAENSKISWCHDTISFWWGCTKHGVGCLNCYAIPISLRFFGDIWGPTKPRLVIESAEDKIRSLNSKAEREGQRRRVFINSMSDFFEDFEGLIVNRKRDVVAGNLNALRHTAFRVFRDCRNLDFLLLTKRPENIRKMHPGGFYENVHLGTSISNQHDADKAVPELLKCRDLSPVLFLSAEPLLGVIDLGKFLWDMPNELDCYPHTDELSPEPTPRGLIDQVIIGIESNGPRVGRLGEFTDEAAWNAAADNIVSQCWAARVAAFVKQIPLGGYVEHDMAKFPRRLQYQEFPVVEAAR